MTMFDYDPRSPRCRWDAPLDMDGPHRERRDPRRSVRAGDSRDRHERHHGCRRRLPSPKGLGPARRPRRHSPQRLRQLRRWLWRSSANWVPTDRRLEARSSLPPYSHPKKRGATWRPMWGFTRDPDDRQRIEILSRPAGDRRARIKQASRPARGHAGFQMRTGRAIRRHGRLLGDAARQPEGTSRPAIYEVGKLFQLDRQHGAACRQPARGRRS